MRSQQSDSQVETEGVYRYTKGPEARTTIVGWKRVSLEADGVDFVFSLLTTN